MRIESNSYSRTKGLVLEQFLVFWHSFRAINMFISLKPVCSIWNNYKYVIFKMDRFTVLLANSNSEDNSF